ncbi:type II toxin-antitoxin system RelE/ParE family toxin [Pantoea phytobeneficialis]|uniref:Diaminopimelate decarboxylase n=1 Tax=Pantoea phytobeneficialis TaxID=2052056 RepID=A0AAP9KSD9_9GAMM|nr:type II toxin-antitoxin system RelE/ParE family toxin [Pantoea phytobeneficialis]MDO6407059.1 type II toxin-antitoxin system RelE/ParE family toxin [Pantoea phytobeneficialis]QGR10019.1 diaminopimelate decarboxylase [Pantoea phytobeneficialis]
MWKVELSDLFYDWLLQQDEALREDMIAALTMLELEGPHLGRPYVDTLHGSKLSNLKELRVQSDGRPVRGFFVFDPERKAIVLCAGNKKGRDEKRFYKEMIKTAESEYVRHLEKLK